MGDISEQLPENDAEGADLSPTSDEVAMLKRDYQSRLLLASLRTEAVMAGMVDLDGLKLLDLAPIQLNQDDRVVGARKIMDDLRRSKPWLFNGKSSSSAVPAPSSERLRPKSAMEMTNEEYAAARTALTKYQF